MSFLITVELFQKHYPNLSWLAHLQLNILDSLCHKDSTIRHKLRLYLRDLKVLHQQTLFLLEMAYKLQELMPKEQEDNIKLRKIK